MTHNNFRLLIVIPALALFACSAEQAAVPSVTSVTLMSFNVQNLFDNQDDPRKDDKAYLPIEAKQSEAHQAACNEIPVKNWRAECLELDWSDLAIEVKLTALAETIRQVNDGKGADIRACH